MSAPVIPFALRGDFIELDKLLKATALTGSGGEARHFISEGQVRVDGQVELRKTAKIRAGQVIEFNGQRIEVQAPA
ncbi:RNA-binding S4 domain-containing protein [Roseateles chitosanitabidus]|jgi:ribosome-associated protein|uniref:RNA-binding S4 domain-containing protein n=1 Tax=Roseateles chitosanitabidus TaxID=65048 RepID=UPI00082A9512|nr:RNA-binding S4 domain-containing protein [Roseateles chitosanitabidus]MBO9688558.1 RNA-binding S4 domain-containing protein [Roseateles chitosanitabidus]